MIGTTGDGEEDKGWLAGFVNMGKKGWENTKKKLGDRVDDLSVAGLEKVIQSEQGQKIGAAFIQKGITRTVEEISDKAKPYSIEYKKYLNPEDKSAYEVIRTSLNPPDNKSDNFVKRIFKNLVATALDVGAGIAGWVSATFINKVLAPKDDITFHDAHNIAASFMSKVLGFFKKKKSVGAPTTA